MTFQRYVAEIWLPNHVVELTTRQSYTYSISVRAHRRVLT